MKPFLSNFMTLKGVLVKKTGVPLVNLFGIIFVGLVFLQNIQNFLMREHRYESKFASQLGFLRLKNFSSHKCFGSRKETRSCIFKNLYFDITTKKFEYYVAPDAFEVPVSFDHGISQYSFSIPSKPVKRRGKGFNREGFLFLHAGGRRGKSQRNRFWYDPWQATLLHGPSPGENSSLVIPDTAILWESVSPNSFGHLLVDNIIPIFIISRFFGLAVEEMQIILMASCEEHLSSTNSSKIAVAWCNKLINSSGLVSPGLTNKSVNNLSKLIQETQTNKKRKILFRKVVLGGGGLGMWLHLQESDYHEKYADPGKRDSRGYGFFFREIQQHFYKQYSIRENLASFATPNVVVLDKHGSRGGNEKLGERKIANIDSVVQWIKTEIPGAHVSKINFQPLSWSSQLDILSKTTIFITPRGSVSFRMLFLPKGAYAIVVSKPTSDLSESNWESDCWFRYQTYFGILNYQLSKSEIATKTEDPKILEDSDIYLTRTKIISLIRQAITLQMQEGV